MTEDADYFYWQKGEGVPISAHFTTAEYTCKCSFNSCIDQKVSKILVQKNEDVRQQLGQSIEVTSGFRCHEHQLQLQVSGLETATGISQHELGNASDLRADDMQHLYNLLYTAYDALGKARSFVHVDTRPAHPDGSKRLWGYLKS